LCSALCGPGSDPRFDRRHARLSCGSRLWANSNRTRRVGAGWAWVGYPSWRRRRSPAHLTGLVMTFATNMMVAAWTWPMFEPTVIAAVSR
jgi:hypothetical protein